MWCVTTWQSKKGQAIKELVRREFDKGRSETDPEKIEALKAKYVSVRRGLCCITANTLDVLLATVGTARYSYPLRSAIRGLSNYLMLANSSKDQRLHDAMNKKSPLTAEYRDV